MKTLPVGVLSSVFFFFFNNISCKLFGLNFSQNGELMCSPFLASIEVPEANRTLALKGLQGQPIQTLSIGDENKFLRREIHALSGTQLAEVTAVGLEAWSFPCTS